MLGVIPAAGKGTRFHELGKQYPKCILPYKEIPILVHNIKSLIDAGCTEIVVGGSHHTSMVKDVVFRFCDDEVEVSVVDIVNSYGMPDTILQCIDVCHEIHNDILIVLGDVIVNESIECQVGKSWISVREVVDYNRWCMVQTCPESGVVMDLFDKLNTRPDTKLAATGVYYMDDIVDFTACLNMSVSNHDSIFDGELQLSDALSKFDGMISTKHTSVVDLGTHDEYMKNRGLSTSREFNEIMKDGNLITKCSNDHEKIRAEYHWFRDLPLELKSYTPAIYHLNVNCSGRSSYSMEFVEKPTLRELFLFLDGSTETWEQVFTDVFDTQVDLSQYKIHSRHFLNKMLSKTCNRFCDLEDIQDSDASLFSEMVETLEILQDDPEFYKRGDSVAHGDFCFSNIMWSPGSVKLIDPRGEMFGSIYYEFAKLYHSIVGRYDFIDAELYTMDPEFDGVGIYDNGKEKIEALFMKRLADMFSKEEIILIKMLSASLFISMIPLHNHNRTNQRLFMMKFREIYSGAKKEYDSY